MPYWETVEVVRYDQARDHSWTETVDRFRNDPHEDNPGWAPHYQWTPDPPERVPKRGGTREPREKLMAEWTGKARVVVGVETPELAESRDELLAQIAGTLRTVLENARGERERPRLDNLQFALNLFDIERGIVGEPEAGRSEEPVRPWRRE